MSLYISSINSGSNGNCYFVGTQQESVLIDVGISCKEIEVRMSRNQLNLNQVKGIFITHEHGDHIRGVRVLSKKYQIPVFITEKTFQRSQLQLEPHLVRIIQTTQPIELGELTIHPFSKFHDAADPYSFRVDHKTIKVGIFTDLGRVCENLIAHFGCCHAAFLEANYDEMMLANSSYPFTLKNRIKGGNGHLSNSEALELFLNYKWEGMSHLVLCHLSENNNHPTIVSNLFKKHSENVHIEVASRNAEGKVYCIAEQTEDVAHANAGQLKMAL